MTRRIWTLIFTAIGTSFALFAVVDFHTEQWGWFTTDLVLAAVFAGAAIYDARKQRKARA